VVNQDIRVSNIKFYYPEESTFWIFDKLNRVVDFHNRHVWNFDLNGYESFQYSEYLGQQGGKYDFHTDIDYAGASTGGDPQTRKLSLSLILNEQGVDYEGGDFQVLIGSQPISIPQTVGSIILFPSWVLHRVTPVTKGVRKSIVVWVTGPKFR
jgi:PKHD-type hydroxylase